MSDQYKLRVTDNNGEKAVFFANNTNDFVEVLLEIDGRELRFGEPVQLSTRGYCYPPHYEKAVAKLKNGQQLPFNASGTVKATVFSGQAYRKEEELDYPAFIWRKLPKKKVRFTRDNNQPSATLEERY